MADDSSDGGDTPSESARGRRDEAAAPSVPGDWPALSAAVAHSDPEQLETTLAEIETFLQDHHHDVADRLDVIESLAEFATEHPSHARQATAVLEQAMDDPALETPALRALAAIAADTPAAVAPVLGSIGDRLGTCPPPARAVGIRILRTLAETDPTALAPAVPGLVDSVVAAGGPGGAVDLPDHERTRRYEERAAGEHLAREAAAILETLGEAAPEQVAPETDRLATVLDPGDNWDRTVARRVLAVLEAVAADAPAEAAGTIEPLVGLVGSERVPLARQGDAIRTLTLLADTHFDAVTTSARRVIPALGDLLSAPDPAVRVGAASLLSYVAEAYPDAVAPLMDVLVDRLSDDESAVRAGVVWTLRYVGTARALDALEDVAASDPDSEVRTLAAERLDER